MSQADSAVTLSLEGHAVRISHPEKPYFTRGVQLSKLQIVEYFLAVAPGALEGIRDRPLVLKRFVNGAHAEPFYQKRAPSDLPEFLRTVTLTFPSGRTADEIVVDSAAGLAWVVNLGCIELHPHPVRSSDLDHPNELRIDLDPGPGVGWADVQQVALTVRDLLAEVHLTGFPKTSGSRGLHINVPIQPLWTFTEVRRAALALARAVERRIPEVATSKWWKEERHGVFLDYNQNAKDRTTASAYSVRPLDDARVSAPLQWDEVLTANPADFTVLTMPARFHQMGDPHRGMHDHPGSLDALLALSFQDEREGLGDAPWPPHFRKVEGEAPRVQPSRARKSTKAFSDQLSEGFGAQRFRNRSQALQQAAPAESTPPSKAAPSAKSGRRLPRFPLITVAQSPDRAAVDAGLARWKAAHPDVAGFLAPDDILVDRMRGSAYIWYRIRVNLRHVPEEQRPAQAMPDPDNDPTRTA